MISESRLKKISEVVSHCQKGIIVVLEDIHDPHNAAAILRTCDAFGIREVWYVFEQEKPYNPRHVGKSSSAATNKWIDYRIFHSTSQCYRALRRKKYIIIATALTPESQSLYSAKLTQPRIAVVFGNEHRGISPYAIANASHVLTIPMRGMAQSLNVSVTAALCIGEISRQRGNKKHYFLSPRERSRLLHAYMKR